MASSSDNEDIPEGFREAIDCLGRDTVIGVMFVYGGRRIYFSRSRCDYLARRLGQAAGDDLYQYYKGENLDIPKADKTVAMWLMAKGWKRAQILDCVSVTTSAIKRWEREFRGATVP